MVNLNKISSEYVAFIQNVSVNDMSDNNLVHGARKYSYSLQRGNQIVGPFVLSVAVVIALS